MTAEDPHTAAARIASLSVYHMNGCGFPTIKHRGKSQEADLEMDRQDSHNIDVDSTQQRHDAGWGSSLRGRMKLRDGEQVLVVLQDCHDSKGMLAHVVDAARIQRATGSCDTNTW